MNVHWEAALPYTVAATTRNAYSVKATKPSFMYDVDGENSLNKLQHKTMQFVMRELNNTWSANSNVNVGLINIMR